MANKALEMIAETVYGFLATSHNGQPKVRPMSFVVSSDKTLWSSTYGVSGKIAEFQGNPQVEVCFMDKGKNHLRIEGRVNLVDDPDKKRQLLAINPKVRNHFSDEHCPNFTLVEVVPHKIRWTEPGFSEYHVIEEL